jgi:ABC-type branched-subunit amino acid transport system substrate-binding protein
VATCHRRRAGASPFVAVLAACAVLAGAAGCGARWSDDQRAELASIERSSGDSGSESATGSGGALDASTNSTISDPGTTSGSTGGGTTGSVEGGTTGGTSGQAPSVPKPCNAPSNAPGITDKTITLGTVNSISGPSPGLGASSLAAARAYIAYRNSIGGVCGRQIVLKEGDDGVDNARNRALVSDFETKTLALISGNACGSDGSAQIIEERKYPVVGLACGTKLPQVSTFFSMSPRDIENSSTAYYRYLVGQGVKKAAVVYVSAEVAAIEGRQKIGNLKASGIQVVLDLPIPLTTLSYDSTARAVANSGADYLVFVHASASSAAMAKAMADTGHKLKYSEYRVAYGSNFIDLAGTAAENTITWITWLPDEDGGSVPEQKLFLQWMQRTAPSAFHDTFANNVWAAAKLLLDSLETEPGPISREALLAGLNGTGKYDAGGLIAPAEIGKHHDSGCMVGMVAKNGKWQRLTPAQGFLC